MNECRGKKEWMKLVMREEKRSGEDEREGSLYKLDDGDDVP